MTEDKAKRVHRASIYINREKDARLLEWLNEQTADGTSESEIFLRLARREMRGDPSPVENELRARIERLEGIIERALVGRSIETGTPTGGDKPPDAKTILDSENWDWS